MNIQSIVILQKNVSAILLQSFCAIWDITDVIYINL